tara:strand:- start:1240 stop:1542 length:303 start_codon:yes stop_codon:yes gene_type:complete
MKEKQRQAIERRLDRKPTVKKESIKVELQKLRGLYRAEVKENKRLRKEIKSLEIGFKKTIGRIDKLVHDESVERVLRRLNDITKEEEEGSDDKDISDGQA